MLAFGMAGSAAGGIDEIFTHLESGPSPASIPNGSYATYAVHVGNIGDAFDDAWADHDFSIVAATGLGGLTVVSPCVQISIWTPGGGIISDVRVYTDPAYTPTGTHTFDLVIKEWDSQGSCTSILRDLWHVSATITVTDPVTQTITFADPPDTTYGVAPFSLGATASSGLPVSYSTSGPCSQSSGTLTVSGAGTCSITASQSGGGGWAAATPVTRSFDIAAASLTVDATDATKTQGEANPVFGATTSGWVNGDDQGDFTTPPTCDSPATWDSPIGTYAINCWGAVAPNYSIGYLPGTLSVVAGPLDYIVISPDSASIGAGTTQPYTAQAFDAGGNSLGDVTGSTVFSIDGSGSCAGSACGSTAPGGYTVTGSYGAVSDTAALTVVAATPHHVVLSPAGASILPGATQAFTVELFDEYGNSLGDVTASTTFSIDGGSCTGADCGSATIGDHTVTASTVVAGIGTFTDTTTLSVTAAPATPTPAITPPPTGAARDVSRGGSLPLSVFLIAVLGGLSLLAMDRRVLPARH